MQHSVPVNERTIALLTSRFLKEESNSARWSRVYAVDEAVFALKHSNADSSHNQRGGRSRGKRGRGAHRKDTQRYRPYMRCTLNLLHKRQTYARRMPNSKETPGEVGKNK